MRDDAKAKREEQVAAAAYAMIEEKGYAGASMLAIARKARASNETLYNWYGDKHGLFRALIVRNTEDVRAQLDQSVADGAAPIDVLRTVAPTLLQMLLGERAIGLNRAAAADPTGALGQTLAAAGRDTIAPWLGQILKQAKDARALDFEATDDAVNSFVSLLVGDLQIRRATHAIPPLTQPEIAARADWAMSQFLELYTT